VEVRVLGPFEAVSDGRPIALPRRRGRALLALLALHANEIVPRQTLIDELWPEHPPESVGHSIDVYVSEVRRALRAAGLGDALLRRPPGYVLVLEPSQLDLRRFEDLAEQGRRAFEAGDPAAASSALADALALWRGPPLADLAEGGFARTEIARLEELRLAFLEDRIEADLALGRHAELVAELDVLAARNPYRERLRGQLILALYRSGRQADALAAYAAARDALVDELGLEPCADLRRLQAAILRQDPGLDVDAPRLRDRAHLPAPMTPLIGRHREQAELHTLVDDAGVRLVTIVGPGGIGKTRLAVEVAGRSVERFPGGVYFVDLVSVAGPDRLPAAIARALDIKERPDVELEDAVERRLEGRTVLVVLDNFEHLLAGATFVADLLRRVPGLKALATSREPLRLYGEHVHALGELGLPAARAAGRDEIAATDSVSLFVARARAVERTFALTPENARTVAEICTRLDGLPLAIELAAPQMRVVSPAELRARLERSLEVLVEGPRDTPARQRTMRAAIQWSYDLLEPDDQRLRSSLSVFVGGWSAEAAEEVCAGDSSALEALAERSLLRREGTRFSMLETIREFASERLDQAGLAEQVRKRHADCFVALGERAELGGTGQTGWLERLECDHANLRAALAWACDRQVTGVALRLAGALSQFWYMRGYVGEGLTWLERALALPGDEATAERARALRGAGILATLGGDYARATSVLSEAVELYRALGDGRAFARALNNLGMVHAYAGDLDRATALLRQSARVYRRLADRDGIAQTTLNLSDVALRRRDYEEAVARSEEGLALAKEIENTFGAAIALQNLGLAALGTGRLADASGLLIERLEISSELGDREGVASSLDGVAIVAAAHRDLRRAAVLLGAADALYDQTGLALPSFERDLREPAVAAIEDRLGPKGAAAAFAEGRALTLEQAVATGLEAAADYASAPAQPAAVSPRAAGSS
jgi:predicted ATPase/DNA-binding SARP family transcriptional activator